MSKKDQLDLEVDATGVDDQLTDLAEKAVDMGCRWLAGINKQTMRPTLRIDDETVVALLKQAAAVQHLLDKINNRKH
jgi:Cu/Ag efflux protein CusF